MIPVLCERRIGLVVVVALIAAINPVRGQIASSPWPAAQHDGVLLPDLTREFERAWMEAQKRVAPGHQALVRKAAKKRQQVRTSSQRPKDQPLGR
jgi:hypothetical protein